MSEMEIHDPTGTNRVSTKLKDIDPTNRLNVEIFGRLLPSPVILGSGTLVEEYHEIQPYLDEGIGAVVPRSTRKVLERDRHPVPHLYQEGNSRYPIMINAEWTGAAINYWEPYLDEMGETSQVIMSLSGRDIEGCKDVALILDKYNYPYLEINISCAASSGVHGQISRDVDHIYRIVSTIKDAGVDTPIALKLGYSDMIVHYANVAKEAGADAIVATNTYGPVFDFTIGGDGITRSVVGISGAKGGLSGSPLFYPVLTAVAEITKQVDIPVIACGGVSTAEHVVKMIAAGAHAVQIYTAAHIAGNNAPQYFAKLNKELIKFMDEHNIASWDQIKNDALDLLEQETNLDVVLPKVEVDECISSCQKCKSICLPKAITWNEEDKATIDKDSCVGCGHCVSVCPTDALVQNVVYTV